MNRSIRNLVVVLVLIVSLCSCQKNERCNEKGDLINYANFYNLSLWRPYLNNRHPTDSLLQNKLLKLSIEIGDFARNAIDASGGLLPNGSLSNPCSNIRVSEKDLNLFYKDIQLIVEDIHKEEKYTLAYEELNKIISHNFFSNEGSLNRKKMLTSNIENIAAKLLFMENMCYYLIVKYA